MATLPARYSALKKLNRLWGPVLHYILISFYPSSVELEEHRRPRPEIERHIVVNHPASAARDWTNTSLHLDVGIVNRFIT